MTNYNNETIRVPIRVPAMIEFRVDDSFRDRLPAILSNVAALKEFAIQQTEIDRNLTLQTESDFAQAKERCATLNSIAKNIDGKRLEVKRAYLKPYEAFEAAIKEVTGVLSTARENLWKQVTEAENAQREARAEKLRHYFDTLECEYRTWEQIYDKKWTNKTTPEAKAMEEIKAAVIGAETDVRAIRALKSDFESTLLASYRSGKTLTECLAMLPMLEKEKAASSEPADENAKVATVRLTVAGTKQQLAGLRDYMQAHGIKYELSFDE